MNQNTTKKPSAKALKVRISREMTGAGAHDAAWWLFESLPQKRLGELGKLLGVPVAKYKAEMVKRLAELVDDKKLPVRVSIG